MKLGFSNDIRHSQPLHKGRLRLKGGSTSEGFGINERSSVQQNYDQALALQTSMKKTAEVNFGGLLDYTRAVDRYTTKQGQRAKTKFLSSQLVKNPVVGFVKDQYKGLVSTLKASLTEMVKYVSKLPGTRSALQFINDNQLMADAIFAMFITCGLRPLMILLLPSKEEDKQKNQYAAAHSISSGILGWVFAALFAGPVARGVKRQMADPKKYMKKNMDYVTSKLIEGKDKTIKSAYKEVAQQLPQLFIMPVRALATVALVPVLIAKVFGITKSKPACKENPLYENYTSKDNNARMFENFTGKKASQSVSFGAKEDVAPNHQVNFEGLHPALKSMNRFADVVTAPVEKGLDLLSKGLSKADDVASETAAKGLGKIAQWNFVEKGCRKLAEWSDNYFRHVIAAEGLYLGGFYIFNTLRSKTIQEDQKVPLAINQGLVTLVATVGAYTLDKIVGGWINSAKNIFEEVNKGKVSQKVLDNCLSGFSKMRTLVAFGLIYRFIAPVMVTPIANRISNELKARKDKKKAEQAKAA